MNNNALQVFSNSEFHVRTINNNGETWFVAKDIAEALEYSNASIKTNIRNLMQSVPDIWKGNKRIITLGGEQEMLCLTEQGVYFFLGRSDKKKALPYQMWIAGEVVPSIRKTGAYALNGDMQKQLHKLETENILLHEKVDAMLEQLAETRSFAALGKVVTLQNGVVSFSEAGKLLAQLGIKIGPNGLMKKAREKNILCKCKGRRYNQPTQKAIKNGLAVLGISFGYKGTPYLTAKGLQFFSDEYVGQFFPLLALIEGGEAVNT